MAETIGSRLRAAREAKGMSIEDVAFETRIHARYVRCLEADDYSNFASTTYAKSFLTLYSRFLGVDAAEALHVFSGGNDIRLGGQPLMATIETIESVRAPRAPKTPAFRAEREDPRPKVSVRRESPGFAPIILGALVFLLIGTIPALWFLGKDAESIDDVTEKAKEIADVTQSRLEPGGVSGSAATGGEAMPPPEAAAGSETAAPGGQAAALSETRSHRERSATADWVLEEDRRKAAEASRTDGGDGEAESVSDGQKPVAVGRDSPGADSPSEEKTPGSDPDASPALVAAAVPTEPEKRDPAVAPAPAVAAKPVEEETGAQAADLPPTPETEETTPAETRGEPAEREESMPAESDPETSPADTPPSTPSTSPAATPLRAVPLIARPVDLSAPAEEEEASDSPVETETDTESEEESDAEREEPAPESEPESEGTPPQPATTTTAGAPSEAPRQDQRLTAAPRPRKPRGAEVEADTEEEEGESRDFVDPRHRFPRPLRR